MPGDGKAATQFVESLPKLETTMRWSDANPQKTFRLQSFGGTMEAEGTFEGFTIPTRIEVGNHFGTAQYLPFFQANLVAAEYLPEGE